jgi:hypothetical protein
MTVVVSGATGMIGSVLVGRLQSAGHRVKRLVRKNAAQEDVLWDPAKGVLDISTIDGCDAIINLAGEPIGQRWSSDAKEAIRQSRVDSTALLARTVASMTKKPRIFLSGSAIGIYGDRGDEWLDEASAPGDDFLASVVKDWEAAAEPVARAGVRLVFLRSGLVLSADGGALAKMLPPFKLGMGGPMGDGNQWMSWIALDDHVSAMMHALATDSVAGPANLVTPNPVTNAEFADALGHALGRPAIVPVPKFALKLMFGEMAEGTILSGQRVSPKTLAASAFEWAFPTIEGALRAVLG